MYSIRLLCFLILVCTNITVLSSQDAVPYRLGDKWGFSDRNGVVLIKPQYEAVGEFFHGRAWVKKRNRYGYINRAGTMVIGARFDSAGDFGPNLKVAGVSRKGERFCVDRYGERVKCLLGCGGGINVVLYYDVYRKDSLVGFVAYNALAKDSMGQALMRIDTFPAIWSDLKESSNGLAAVKLDGK